MWKLNHENYFYDNNIELAGMITKFIKECTDNCITEDAIANLILQELIIENQTTKRFKNDYFISVNSSEIINELLYI